MSQVECPLTWVTIEVSTAYQLSAKSLRALRLYNTLRIMRVKAYELHAS